MGGGGKAKAPLAALPAQSLVRSFKFYNHNGEYYLAESCEIFFQHWAHASLFISEYCWLFILEMHSENIHMGYPVHTY